jgi:hypothetical protein
MEALPTFSSSATNFIREETSLIASILANSGLMGS